MNDLQTINFQDWGLMDYQTAWQRQEEIFQATIARKKNGLPTKNHLVFCQHPHVYTLGKSGDENNMLLNYIQLQAHNAQFVRTNRGGDITYHGPGQLVGYPIFDLENFRIGLRQYIFLLEETIITLLNSYNISASRINGAAGVWLDADNARARKICAIGVRSSHFVTMHGFALNLNTDLTYFNHINPCGFSDKGVTSLAQETGKTVDFGQIQQELRIIFEKNFNALC